MAAPNSPQGPVRVLGPVSDLERHLPVDWWRTLFNSIYLKTDGDVVENAEGTRADIDRVLDAAQLKSTDKILDLCCGQGRHSLELARRGFDNVTGHDRSRYLIRLARQRARKEGLNVRFREGDARKIRAPEGGFDCVILMGNSFGYFDREEDDQAVLGAIRRALKPGGKLVIDITDGDWVRENFDARSWEWIDQEQFVCRERSLSADKDRLICREVVVHAEKGVIADQFYAERLYSQDRIQRLLERAGFETVRFHSDIAGRSTREQDLGMMARRLFLSCNSSAKPDAELKRVPFPDVCVLLGDPRRPDTVKKGGQFNEEDLDTVRRLKEALSTLTDYDFTYHDDHATLMEMLEKERPEFIFNLCDEGYRNDALMELHVPAMLEAQGIPYSGAGPASLGLCYNKALVRAIALSLDIPVPLETYDTSDGQASTLPSVFPALIKPGLGDSSIGITVDSVVYTPEEAVACINRLRKELPGRPILIQEYLQGAEYSVALVGNPGADMIALPILTVDYSKLPDDLPKILGYESKWLPDSPYWTAIQYRPAELSDEVRRNLTDWSSALFERLACRDYARFDFRADTGGTIKLLEVNPNPGWCWDGKFNLMAEMAGYSYPDLLRMIIEAAQRRIETNNAEKAQQVQAAE